MSAQTAEPPEVRVTPGVSTIVCGQIEVGATLCLTTGRNQREWVRVTGHDGNGHNTVQPVTEQERKQYEREYRWQQVRNRIFMPLHNARARLYGKCYRLRRWY